MPIAEANGQKFEFPEGTTPEQIGVALGEYFSSKAANPQSQPEPQQPQESTIENGVFKGLTESEKATVIADNRVSGRGSGGNKNRYEKAANKIRLQKSNPALAEELESMGGGEKALVALGSGFATLGRGVGLLDKQDESEKASTKALFDTGGSGLKVAELAGESLPFIAPSAAVWKVAHTVARILASAGLGSAEGGIISKGKGGDTNQILLGAGLGAVIGGGAEALLPVLNRYGRKLLTGVGKKAPDQTVMPDGSPTPELQKALDEKGIDYNDIIEAAKQDVKTGSPASIDKSQAARNQERQDAFESMDIVPTEAQRTRDKDLFLDQQDSFKQSTPVTRHIEGQEAQLDYQAGQAVSDTGGEAARASTSPIEAITKKATQLDDEISVLYKAARDASPNAKNVRFTKTAQMLRAGAPADNFSGNVIEALKGTMEQMGVLKGFKTSGRVTVDQAESLRKMANKLYPSATPYGKGVIREFKEALDEDVLKVNHADVYKQARDAKANFEQGLTKDRLGKFDQNKTSLVRDILSNKVEPDHIAQGKLFKAGSVYKASDIAELKKYLTTGTKEQIKEGQRAWDDVRASAMQSIKDKAFSGPVTERGTKSLTRAGLEKGIKAIGEQKFRVLFNPRERRFLSNLSKVAAFKEAPPATFTGTGPSGTAIKRAAQGLKSSLGSLSKIIPFVGDVIEDIAIKRASNAQVKAVLNLTNDAKSIIAANEKLMTEQLRKSTLYQSVVATVPAGGAIIAGKANAEVE